MIHLTREVRFSVDPAQRRPLETPRLNSWSGWPSAVSLAPYPSLRIAVAGMPDRPTGYLWVIRCLDRTLHLGRVQVAYDLSVEVPSDFTGARPLARSYPWVAGLLPGH